MNEKLAAEMTTEELYDYVMEHSNTGDPHGVLTEFIDGSQIDDDTTANNIVAAWDESADYTTAVMNGL